MIVKMKISALTHFTISTKTKLIISDITYRAEKNKCFKNTKKFNKYQAINFF